MYISMTATNMSDVGGVWQDTWSLIHIRHVTRFRLVSAIPAKFVVIWLDIHFSEMCFLRDKGTLPLLCDKSNTNQ